MICGQHFLFENGFVVREQCLIENGGLWTLSNCDIDRNPSSFTHLMEHEKYSHRWPPQHIVVVG